MNTSSCNFVAVVLLTPSLKVVQGDPVCSLSISFEDDKIGERDHWVHTMLRCHKTTATYASKNLKKGDLIFVANARYHVDETEDIKGNVKRTHYFSRGSIQKLTSEQDRKRFAQEEGKDFEDWLKTDPLIPEKEELLAPDDEGCPF